MKEIIKLKCNYPEKIGCYYDRNIHDCVESGGGVNG